MTNIEKEVNSIFKNGKKEIKMPLLDPKTYFCEGVFIRGDKDKVILSMASQHAVISEFAFTPEHLKRFAKVLNENIAAYEKKFGEIKIK